MSICLRQQHGSIGLCWGIKKGPNRIENPQNRSHHCRTSLPCPSMGVPTPGVVHKHKYKLYLNMDSLSKHGQLSLSVPSNYMCYLGRSDTNVTKSAYIVMIRSCLIKKHSTQKHVLLWPSYCQILWSMWASSCGSVLVKENGRYPFKTQTICDQIWFVKLWFLAPTFGLNIHFLMEYILADLWLSSHLFQADIINWIPSITHNVWLSLSFWYHLCTFL